MKIKLSHNFEEIISVENLLEAWREFLRGKRAKRDVQEFSMRLMNNIFSLHNDLSNHTYKHGEYQAFKINDPKPRDIHKASVRDRLLHHAIYRKLYPFFEKVFITDSFSCRINKGTHKAMNRFRAFARKVGKNDTKTCWILKCDIKKFFASIDHEILKEILAKHISDKNTLLLLDEVVNSFNLGNSNKGLPLGNLTSQLLVNIYMNEFDQFVKHKLKTKHYIRYADDFVLFSDNKKRLEDKIEPIKYFLKNKLKLEIHEDKIQIKTLSSGVDFLGWVHFSDHRVLRTKTKKRMFKRMAASPFPETTNSYLGLLGHGDAYKLEKRIFESTTTAR